MSTDAILQAALEYAARGWLLIPIRYKTKRPHPTAWQKAATSEEDVLTGWWTQWPDAGVGVRLGRDSNLIDIECDDEQAEQTLLGIFGGQVPYTATYAGARGKHRLFQWTDELPNQDKAVWKIGNLEFRTGNGDKGAQSVLPPSIHPNGKRYEWLIPVHEAGVARLPESAITAIWNSGGEDIFTKAEQNGHAPSIRQNLYTQEVIPEGQRDNTIYAEACEEWRKERAANGHRAFDDPAVQGHVYERMWVWNQVKCKPPLTDQEIFTKVESAKKFIQNQKFEEHITATRTSLSMHGLEFRDGEWWPGNWELTVILSKPPIYLLTVPAWGDMLGEDDSIELAADIYREANAVAQAIFTATKTVIVDDRPGGWPAIWNGSPGSKKEEKPPIRGLKAKLLDQAKTQEAPAQWKRPAVVAELLAEKIALAGAKEEPDKRGKAVRMPDGTLWLRWAKAWEEDISLRKVTPQELQQLSRAIGLTEKDSRRWPNKGGSNRLRYFVLDEKHTRRLDEIRESPGEPPPEAPAVA